MKPLPLHLEKLRLERAILSICAQGWTWIGGWLFRKGDQTHDLSAADLTKLDGIYLRKSFIVDAHDL